MEEKKLLTIASIATIVGLAFLFFYAQEADLPIATSLDEIMPAEDVTMAGTIQNVQEHGNVTFIKLAGERVETVDVVVFKADALPLQVGDQVKIQGTVEVYQGKKEIIASTVELH
ncbi:hypothetical protein HYU22_04555 [Candidatus Woesearchaeota archaeon]|nr:hypothetical protein [Candidatus Woesearchaeota archaeon]